MTARETTPYERFAAAYLMAALMVSQGYEMPTAGRIIASYGDKPTEAIFGAVGDDLFKAIAGDLDWDIGLLK